MPKSVTLGNGKLLICLNRYGQVRDLYYHYAGLENHVSEDLAHKIGIFLDGRLSWLDDSGWQVSVNCESDTMAGTIDAINKSLGVKLEFTDVVYNEKNIFIRQINVKNEFDRNRNLKIYFYQQFNISQTHTGDTAYYDPGTNSVIHYKGRRAFLLTAKEADTFFQDYSTGIFGIEGKEGTFRDAEDGELSKGGIEHGQVDSTFSLEMELKPKENKKIHYWMTVGKSIRKTKSLNDYVLKKTPEYLVKSTKDYWNAWITNQNFTFYGLSDDLIALFNKSLVNIRTHVSYNGAIIASGDSDLLQYGRDTYSYVWPRDAANAACALAKAGDFNASKRFFEFCSDIIADEGYFMHKYRPDKAMGSSWHPWIRHGKPELPIQEDETAIVLNSLWVHFELSKDLEFIESIYNKLIKRSAEFMAKYRDNTTGLPKPSYDLWEMKWGVHTYTAACVYGALNVAAKFANLLGKEKSSADYYKAANEIKEGIMKHLYDDKTKTFYKNINIIEGKKASDVTVDMSSVYGIYKFGVLEPHDELLRQVFKKTVERLSVKTKVGGIARFEGDIYHYKGGNIPGNPWIITTLWNTQYKMEFMEKEKDIPEIVKEFNWVKERALSSGVLPEQVDPYTNEQLSAAPLTWSHAEYVISVVNYLEKLEELGICEKCYPVS